MSTSLTVKAECCDPYHQKCKWKGSIWLVLDHSNAECEACPNCGGYKYMVQIRATGLWEHTDDVTTG